MVLLSPLFLGSAATTTKRNLYLAPRQPTATGILHCRYQRWFVMCCTVVCCIERAVMIRAEPAPGPAGPGPGLTNRMSESICAKLKRFDLQILFLLFGDRVENPPEIALQSAREQSFVDLCCMFRAGAVGAFHRDKFGGTSAQPTPK